MQPVAAVGVGQSHHASKRVDVSLAGLIREAVLRALDHAELTFADIDAVVLGSAPDVFEGVMLPEQWLVGALGAHGKPILRIHTAGSVGGATAIAAVHHVAAGVFSRVLAVAFEKHSESQALWGLSPHIPFMPPFGAGAGAYFAPYCRAYMEKFGAPPEIGSRSLPPSRSFTFENTRRSARRCWTASPNGNVRPSRRSALSRRPTPTAQSIRRRFTPVASANDAVTAVCTFS